MKNVELQHRNVCKDGFGDVENVEASEHIQARCTATLANETVFLDLPAPWEAIPFAVKNLNVSRRRPWCPNMQPNQVTRICCFSPCIEQVLKTATTLREEGFTGTSSSPPPLHPPPHHY